MASVLYRHQDDHAAAPPPAAPAEASGADAADVARLQTWLETIGECVDADGLPQSGPLDRPLAMPLQELKPAWFSSLLEILGVASWRHAPKRAIMQSDG